MSDVDVALDLGENHEGRTMASSSAPLERDRRKQERVDWEAQIKHTEPRQAHTGTVIERGLSFQLDGKFGSVWEPACLDFEGEQLRLARAGAKNVNLTYRVKFDPGYNCPDQTKIINSMSARMLGWPTKFKPGDAVTVYCWRNEQGYVQWGIKQ